MNKRVQMLALAGLAALGAGAVSIAAPDPFRVLEGQIAEGDLKGVAKTLRDLPKADQDRFYKALSVERWIVNGVPVEIADHPWQVALIRGYVDEPRRAQFCGGSLIAPDMVLTAAHCVDNPIVRRRASRLDIVAGATGYASGGERLKADAIFVHPQWDDETMDYDFAIVKLKTASTLGRRIALASGPATPGVKGMVTGWGAIAENGPTSDRLLGADVPIVANTECARISGYDPVTDRMLCAGFEQGGTDSCQGDSGGPFVVSTSGSPVLTGVVSWGEGCARKERFGVYANVASVEPWIRTLMAGSASVAAAGGVDSGGR
jgi:secreted trypsin-like serine protease